MDAHGNAGDEGDELRETARELLGRRSLRFATGVGRQRRRIRGHSAVGSLLDPVQTDAGRVNATELLQATLDLAGKRSVRIVTRLANLGSRVRGRPRVGSLLDPLIDTLVESRGKSRSLLASSDSTTPDGHKIRGAPRLDIVVLAKGRGSRVASTLTGLDDGLDMFDGALVLVDDGADEDAISLAEAWASERGIDLVRIESDPVPGLSRGFRRALEAGEADTILLVTAGATPLPGACESLIRELEENRTAVAVSGLRIPRVPDAWVPAELAAAAADSRLGPGAVSPMGGLHVTFCAMRRDFLEDHAFAWFVKERRRDRALVELVAAAKRSRRSLLQTASAAVVLKPGEGETIRLDPHEDRIAEVLGDLARTPRVTADVLQAALSKLPPPVRVVPDSQIATAVRGGIAALGLGDYAVESSGGVAFAFDAQAADDALDQAFASVVLCDSGQRRDKPTERMVDAMRRGRLRLCAPTRARRKSLEELGWPVAGLVPVPVLRSVFKPREDDPLLGAVRCVVVRTGEDGSGPAFARSLAVELGPAVAVLTLGSASSEADSDFALTHRPEEDAVLAASTLGAADLFVDLGPDDLCATWTARALCCGAPALAVRGSSGAELVASEPALIVHEQDALASRIAHLLADHHELLRLRALAGTLAERHGEVSVAAGLLAIALLR